MELLLCVYFAYQLSKFKFQRMMCVGCRADCKTIPSVSVESTNDAYIASSPTAPTKAAVVAPAIHVVNARRALNYFRLIKTIIIDACMNIGGSCEHKQNIMTIYLHPYTQRARDFSQCHCIGSSSGTASTTCCR